MQREEEDATTIEIPSVVLETFDSRNKRHVRHMPGKLRHPREGFSLFKLFSLGCFCRESFILLLVLCSLQMIRPMVYLIEMDSHETGSLCLLNGDQRELISRWLILLFLSPLPSLVLLALLFVTHSQLFFAFKKSQYRCTCSWRFLWYYFLGRENCSQKTDNIRPPAAASGLGFEGNERAKIPGIPNIPGSRVS